MVRVIRRAGPVAAIALASMLGVPAVASAPNPPACDPAVYPRPFLAFESVYRRNTRWVQMREREDMDAPRDQGDPESPFPLRVDLSNGRSKTYTIHDYPRDQVAIRFKRREKATVTATYVEVHTEYSPLDNGHNVRCTRVVRTHYKAPPGPHSRHYHP